MQKPNSRNHCTIAKSTFAENMHNDVVRTMLLLGQDFHMNRLNEVYKSLGLYVSEMPNALTTLLDQRIVLGREDSFGFYKSSDPMYINPVLVYDILAQIQPDDMIFYYMKGSNARSTRYSGPASTEEMYGFYTAVCLYLHGKQEYRQWLDERAEDFYTSNTVLSNNTIGETTLRLLEHDDMHDFFLHLPPTVKKDLAAILTRQFEGMESVDTEGRFRYLFFDNDGLAYDSRLGLLYTLYCNLLPNGHIDELIAASHDTFITSYLKAIRQLHNGKSDTMLGICQQLYESKYKALHQSPVMVMYMMAAIMMSDNRATTQFGAKMYKSRELKKEAPLLRALLHVKLTGKVDTKLILDINTGDCLLANQVVFTLFAMHFQLYLGNKNEPSFIKQAEYMVNNSEMIYLRMLFAAEDPQQKNMYDELAAQTGMSSLFPYTEKKEAWEIEIDRLLEQTQTKSAKQPSVCESVQTSRVVYLVDMRHFAVQPILQKSTDGVTWTRGRNIALKKFKRNETEGMSEFDRLIASYVVERYEYYGGTYYDLGGNLVIQALTGHPLTFTDDDNRLKIDITQEPLQLSTSTDGRGAFHLKTNVSLNEISNGYYVKATSATSISVTHVTSQQKAILESLIHMDNLPSRAKDKLTQLLENLSTGMTVMSPLLGTGTADIMHVATSNVIVLQLVPIGNDIRVALYAKPLNDQPPYMSPAKGMEYVSGKRDGKTIQTRRDMEAEWKNAEQIRSLMDLCDSVDNDTWILSIEQTLTLLNCLNDHRDVACVEWPEGVKMKVTRPEIKPSDIHLSVHKMAEWFAVEGEVQIDKDTQIKVTQLMQMLGTCEGRFVRLDGDEYVALSEQLTRILKDIERMQHGTDKQLRLSQFCVTALDELEQAGVEIEADKSYRDLMRRIEEASKENVKVPRGIQAELREYQKDGYRWMMRLAHWGAGACLADDMGLGKTLQSITLMYARRTDGPSLVVAPTSVLLNWQDEITRFAPSLRTVLFNRQGENRESVVRDATASDVVITSYGLFVTEQELLASRQWNVVVLDEAHTIKNRETKMSRAAMTLQSNCRIALTGTPLQNRLAEIWNLFQFLNPGLLGTYQHFTDHFITPIEKYHDRQRQTLLKRMLSPFILRRTKGDVLAELPGKTEITVKVDLSAEERAVYENLRHQAEVALENGEQNPMQALAEITRLRQVACNTRLIDNRLDIESSKGATFMRLVENLHNSRHRALVFSQFTSHLALIREMLDKAGYSYLYLDGSTPIKQRAALVNEFQTGDKELFLISLKAGGLGLNLTAADYVIHLDPWWNPAIEDQATDRSYRIGQQNPVTVYRLVAADTIEEKILRLHAHKKSLADALLEGSELSARLTRDEILSLLQSI